MIGEAATHEKFGYHSYDLSPKSNRKIVAVCDECGKVRVIKKGAYRTLCLSCSLKGERNPNFGKKGESAPNWNGGKIKRICEVCGTKFPVNPARIKNGCGRFCSPKCYGEWVSKNLNGANSPLWQGGISFEPYCHKFNEPFKEYIRTKFGRICFLCSKTEEEEGRKLSVHHVNYNKGCGCDKDETCQFVPLCRSCNSKVNFNREMWEKKIKAKMRNKLSGWVI